MSYITAISNLCTILCLRSMCVTTDLRRNLFSLLLFVNIVLSSHCWPPCRHVRVCRCGLAPDWYLHLDPRPPPPASSPAVSMSTPPLVSPFGGQPPPPQQQQQQQQQHQQAQAAHDVNTASLCRIGQETVQDIVLRTMEIFQLLRNMQVRLTPALHACHL